MVIDQPRTIHPIGLLNCQFLTQGWDLITSPEALDGLFTIHAVLFSKILNLEKVILKIGFFYV